MTLPLHSSPHVVHLDHTTEHGGAELALARLLRDQDRGWDATLVIPNGLSDGVFEGLESKGLRIERVGKAHRPGATNVGTGGALKVAWSLITQAVALRFSKTFSQADVIHANSTRSALYGAIALVGLRTPLVVHLRDRIEPEALGNLGYHAFRWLVAPRVSKYIANSAATAATVNKMSRENQSITVIPSAIGVTRNANTNDSNLRPRIGMVARLDDWKGQDLLVQAFADAGLDDIADLVLFGDAAFGKSGFAKDLHGLVDSLNLKHVEFPGFVHDVQSAIDSLDICVQYSTRPEPLGQNVLQYLARGKAVVAAAEGGPMEWITDGENGLLVPPRSIPALSEALKVLTKQPQKRESLERGARAMDGLPTDEAIVAAHASAFRASAERTKLAATVLAWPRSTGDNPYAERLYSALENFRVSAADFSVRRALVGSYDLLHVHWPEGIIHGSAFRAYAAIIAQRIVMCWVRIVRRKPIVWTVHNLKPHAQCSPAMLALLQKTLKQNVSGALFLSDASRAEACAVLPWLADRPSAITFHGRYDIVSHPPVSREAIRTSLRIEQDQKVVAFIGRVEPYKGLDILARVISEARDSQVRLLVAGRFPDTTYGRDLRRLLESPGAILEEGWVTDERFAELVQASDLVVYPYRSILNSGSILLPLEYGVRVLAPAMGSIPEMASLLGEDWVRTFTGDLEYTTITDALRGLPRVGDRPELDKLNWDSIAGQTAEFYRRLPRPNGRHSRCVGPDASLCM